MASTQDSWSNIPPELAGLVLKRLHAHVDRVRFAAVCPQWRTAARQVRLPPPPPLLALKFGHVFYSMPRGEPLRFAGSKEGFATACGNWLVYRRFCELLLVDPFSGATMTLPAPSRVHLPGASEDEVDDWQDSADDSEDFEDGHDSADEGHDSEDGSVPSRVHLPGKDEGDDSTDGHDFAEDGGNSEGGHDSADEGDDSEDGHDSADDVDDSEDGHDSADDGDESGSAPSGVHLPDKDEGDNCMDGHDSANDAEDSVGDHDSADEGADSEDGSVYSDELEQLLDVKSFEVIKLMECSPNLFAALIQGSESSRVAVCRPGGSKWSVAWDLSFWITDMAFYQGKLYVVDYDEELLALDISMDDKTGDPWISRIGQVINVNQFDNDRTLLRTLYLVESCGSLLLVRRRIFHKHIHGEGQMHTFAGQCEPDVSIFKADFGQSQWCKVTTLADNLALFLGPCSRSVWMPESDSSGNRVWFLDDYKDFHTWNEWPSNILSSETSSVANPKAFSPLPMISWRGYPASAGAAWLFPSN